MKYRLQLWLLPLAALGLGCSATGGRFGRSAEDSKIRTIASIGDRPVSSTTGTPASAAVANLDTGERRKDGRDLVSGRVLDDQGEPVANAKVRIADGGLSGGKVVQAKTNRAGGFTLHGLRPGSTYTLIAEYEGQGGLVEGRAEARPPQSEVEIAMSGEDEPLDRRRASRSPPTRNISERQPIAGSENDEQHLRVNQEDITPATEVEDIDDLAGKTSLRRSQPSVISTSGWRRSEVKTAKERPFVSSADGDRATRRASTKNTIDTDAPAEDQAEPPTSSPSEVDPPQIEVDESENPLPPAIESSGKRGRDADRPPGRDEEESTERPTESRRFSQSNPKSPGSSPGALVLAKEAPAITRSARKPAQGSGVEAEQTSSHEPSINPFVDRVPPREPKAAITFGDLAAAWQAAPRPEPENESAAGRPRSGASPETNEIASIRETLPKFVSKKGCIETVRYDSKNRRLVDFRLPDLDGRSVSLHDLDNDLILLDFWGTWCRPCLSSVPHLIELQNRLGAKGLTIVGIACEEGPATANAAHVAEVAERLGINYTVLLSSKDEASPLLEALHIQAFPTLIVIDRRGQVVWRDSGASDVTLARLDRVVDRSSRAVVGDRVRR